MFKFNSHSEYSRPAFRRRRGQALLMAVLVMVFVSLIGATFITVVAINIGQTQRGEEKDKARQAAQAGLAFANLQLTEGEFGTQWRADKPEKGGVLPAASNDSFYWTPFDQAQGWHTAGFAKFPDPRSTNPSFSAPNYMVKVEKVLPNDPIGDNDTGDKTGMLRITTIGLSPDDPATFDRLVAYKAGPAQQPLTGAMRSVSNWDFLNSTVPSAQTSSAGSGTNIPISDVEGKFPTSNFYVLVGNPGTTLRSAYVTGGSATSLSLASSLTWNAGERVEVAATLGAPLAIDYNKDGVPEPDAEKVVFDVSKSTALTPGSTMVNGGLIFSGNTLLQNLRAPEGSGGNTVGQVRATGLIQVVDTGATKVSGTYSNGTSSGQQTLLDSSSPDFPYSGAGTVGLELVSDGANRINNSTDPTRQNKPFTPPNLSSGNDGFGRYRQLTKYSPSLVSDPQGAAYGYGEGIYINNVKDRERKGTTTAGRFVDMTQSDLLDLWYKSGPDTGSAALRLSQPISTATATASLEEMHLRGWIGPNEFRARGALIELDPQNVAGPKVHITLDSRDDGRSVTYPNGALTIYPFQGPVPDKGWRDADGTLAGDDIVGGIYRETFAWPANGVIFAEGNVRVRGGAFDSTGKVNTAVDPGRSLTIVSMRNIYIEGSLNAGARKVMLLAKMNAVMNPTRAIERAESHTRLSANTSTTSRLISVHNASSFQEGEEIMIGINNLRRTIFRVVDGRTLELTTAPTARTAGEVVKAVEDPLRNDNTAYHNYATRVSRFSDVLQRRVYLPGGASEMRLAFRHSAERRDALTVTTEQALADLSNPPQLSSATLSHKLAADALTTVIQPPEKNLGVTYTDTAESGTHLFPQSVPATELAAITYRVGEATDSDLVAADDDLTEDLNNRRGIPNWKYSATIKSFYDQNVGPTLKIPPSYFLAAVGNRPDIDPAIAPTTYPARKNIFVGSDYTIPMATSVQVMLNGARQSLRSDYFNVALSSYEFVNQFGFNFTFGAGVASAVDNWEDVLTGDQSFYRNGTGAKTAATYDDTYYALDSRTMTTGITSGWNRLALRFNPAVENYFDATPEPTPPPSIPYYRLSRLKLENDNQLNSDHQFENLNAGFTFDVHAYVYAQEGSWLVIPGGYFDNKINTDASGAYMNLDGDNPSERDPGENADLNRDGIVSRGEEVAAYRFARYNYQINFNGAIMENQTAIIDPDGPNGPLVGPVADWTDKWATVKIFHEDTDRDGTLDVGEDRNDNGILDTNWSGTSATDTFTNNLRTDKANFGTISYTYDPTAASGALDDDDGFRTPASPELIYQSG